MSLTAAAFRPRSSKHELERVSAFQALRQLLRGSSECHLLKYRQASIWLTVSQRFTELLVDTSMLILSMIVVVLVLVGAIMLKKDPEE